MAIGQRIRFFRGKKGISQVQLGKLLGFSYSVGPRISQYETGYRVPKAGLTKEIASILDISPNALTAPDVDSNVGLMHTLFALEDLRGLTVGEINGEICLRFDKSRGENASSTLRLLREWAEQVRMLKNGEITQEAYDSWRYNYPKYNTLNVNHPGGTP